MTGTVYKITGGYYRVKLKSRNKINPGNKVARVRIPLKFRRIIHRHGLKIFVVSIIVIIFCSATLVNIYLNQPKTASEYVLDDTANQVPKVDLENYKLPEGATDADRADNFRLIAVEYEQIDDHDNAIKYYKMVESLGLATADDFYKMANLYAAIGDAALSEVYLNKSGRSGLAKDCEDSVQCVI